MTTEAAVPEVLTKEIILSWQGSEMLKRMKDPATRAEIERIFNAPELDVAVEAQSEEQRLAAEAAENARIEAEATAAAQAAYAEAEAKKAEEAAKTPVYKKLVVEYQATDPSTGAKIGRPTHLESQYIEGDKDSLIAAYQEMSEKQRIAHVNATQALENIKKRQATFVKDEVVPVGLTEDEIKKISSELDDDPEKAKAKVEAIRKLSNADAAETREREAQLAKAAANAEKASYAFMRTHLDDFFPCQANSDILTAYITDNKLEWTQDNLEIAFAATESQLAPAPSKPAEIVPPAQVPVAPVAQVQPVVIEEPPAAPSVVTAPVAAPSADPVNPAQPQRRVPNGGLQPGQMSGRPPVQTPAPGLTKRDVLKMPRDEYKQKIKNPAFRAQVNALFAEK